MDIKDIYEEINDITIQALQKAYDNKYFEDGTEKMIQNTPLIKSLSEIARKLMTLNDKIEKTIKEG